MPASSTFVIGLILAIMPFALDRPASAAEPHPNVLLIISDDQGFGDFGFNGNKLVQTPNLDRLVSESAVFRNFVVAPACSPTRAAIFTGRDHLLTGVWGVPPRANLNYDETMMPAFFKAAGYGTLHVGKEDCVRITEYMPWRRGWDNSIGGGGGYTHRDPTITQKSGNTPAQGWTAELWTDRAIQFIRDKHDAPWFASVAYIIPHMPWVCPEKYSAPFLAQGCSAELAACYGSIAQMDECIGRLLAALRETGQDQRTVVAFVSDNGQTGPDEKPDADGNVHGVDWDRRNVAHLRGGKAMVWENGIRVPLVVRWPGRIAPGARAQFGCAEDILPTLLDLAGVEDGNMPHHLFTGVSLRPALNDAKTTFERPEAFRMAIAFAGSPKAPAGIVPDPQSLKFEDHHLALRGPRFKYHALPGGGRALYDLDADPGEQTDVQARFPEVAARMAATIRARWNEVIASGRAFRMPPAWVRGDVDELPPNNHSRLPGTAAQSLSGKVQIGREAYGFAAPGDSATYGLLVGVAGSYDIVLGGEGFDACQPLTIEIDGRLMAPAKTTPDSIRFAHCELLMNSSKLRVVAGNSTAEATPARLRWITFFPRPAEPVLEPVMTRVGCLTTGPGGTFLMFGQPYRAIGVNYFNCFLRTLANRDDTSYEAGFGVLEEKGIPFARFCATGFWPRDMKLYREDRTEYFRRLDGVIRAADDHNVGLVPSLFWHYSCVPDLVGEPMQAWANPASKTQAWMREYVREVVTRYRDKSTIWAWEFGNEYSLAASLPNAAGHRAPTHPSLDTPATRSERDDLAFDMVRIAFQAFATEVRKYDPDRPIITGDSFLRPSAWHQWSESSWKRDTPEQFAAMLKKINPDPIDAISVHAYEDDEQRLATAVETARKLNKPLFVGEFGATGETPEQAAQFRRLLKTIVDQKVPMAALWVFDHKNQQDWNVTAENARHWQLDEIQAANKQIDPSKD